MDKPHGVTFAYRNDLIKVLVKLEGVEPGKVEERIEFYQMCSTAFLVRVFSGIVDIPVTVKE